MRRAFKSGLGLARRQTIERAEQGTEEPVHRIVDGLAARGHFRFGVEPALFGFRCGRFGVGKPRDRDEAMAMLGRLSDRAHWVYTAVVVRRDDRSAEVVAATRVWFAPLTRQAIARYCDGPEPYDKAGAYGIQGRAAVFIHRIEGSDSNVVGLPLYETAQLLERFGIRP